METKYTLTIEQIQTIIENYKLGEYCKNNCYGCCGSDNYHSHCKDCVPKMKKHIEEMTSVTLEQVKKEWEELGYEWIDNCDFIELLNKSKEELFVIDTIHKKFAKSDDKVKFTLYVTFKEHELITKTFKWLGWEE